MRISLYGALAGLEVLLMLGVAATASVQTQPEDRIGTGSLFVAAESPTASLTTGPDAGVLRERFVRLDHDVLEAARVNAGRAEVPPALLRLDLFDDVALNAVVERAGPTSAGYWLSGRIEGWDLGSITLVVNGDVIAGTVRAPSATYAIRSVGDGVHAVRQLDPATELPYEDNSQWPAPLSRDDDSPHPASSPQASVRARPLRPAAPSTSQRAEVPPEEDGSRIDVMVVYTPAARDAQGGQGEIEAVIDLWVAETNQAYADSGVIQRLNLVLASMVDYEEAGPDARHGLLAATVDLYRLRRPDDGHLDEVIGLMDRYAADIVTLVGHYSDESGGVALGYCPEDDKEFAFAACGNVVNYDVGGLTYAHELGHNMGLNHDRYEVTRCWRCKPPPEQDLRKYGPFPYAFGYVNQRAFEPGAPVSSRWVTIMAYRLQCSDAGFGCQGVPRFSNPDLTWNGDPMGVPGDEPSPLVTDPADARRTLNETRRIVAKFRVAPCLRDGMRIRLQASNGQYVVAVGNGGGDVLAVGSRLGPWGEFTLVDANGGCVESGDAVSLHTSDGFFLRAAQGGGATLDATDPQATPWAQFIARRHRGGGAIRDLDAATLQVESGHYVCAEQGGGGVVQADCDSPDPLLQMRGPERG